MENHPPPTGTKPTVTSGEADISPTEAPPHRTPFTSLGQVEADLALARTLQEQERAYMMLTMNRDEGSDYTSSESEVEDGDGDPDYEFGDEYEDMQESVFHDDDDDAFDAMDRELNPNELESSEDCEYFSIAMQEGEGRDLTARLMVVAGLNERRGGSYGNQSGDESLDEDAWEDADPDELSYEELVALGEVIGTENKGLSANTIASLPSANYEIQNVQDGNIDQCVICRMDYEDGESLVVLQCKHSYHTNCINKWLQINKVCPICSVEVTTCAWPNHKTN